VLIRVGEPLMECECCVALSSHMRKHVSLVECTRLNSARSRTLSRCNVDVLAQERMVGYPQVLRVVAACKCLQQLMCVCVCE
jgi:hypothetical protein